MLSIVCSSTDEHFDTHIKYLYRKTLWTCHVRMMEAVYVLYNALECDLLYEENRFGDNSALTDER